MQKLLDNATLNKIKSFSEIKEILEKLRENKAKVVQCHGVFDLLHPGHIRHFKEAKKQGDILIVTLTPDRFVNKGPGRPAFSEDLRLESIAALTDIDYVILNDAPDAVPAIHKIRPSIYVKGLEYSNHEKDVTGKISEEATAIKLCGGTIYYTDDIVFSSSTLINRHIDTFAPHIQRFLDIFKTKYSSETILQCIDSLQHLKVLVIGDAIIDEYQYAEPMGQSGKGLHMCARTLDKDIFLGGSLIIANHVAQFSNHVTLLTALGKECPHLPLIRKNLDPKIVTDFVYLEETTTLTKKRYVLKDGKTISKLFETYSGHEEPLSPPQTNHILHHIETKASDYDLIITCDFGNGFTNPLITDALSNAPTFLALNTQTNSGNRGYNVVTNYTRADFISLNEPELRLAANNKTGSLEGISSDICQIMQCPTLSVTRGVHGVFCFTSDKTLEIPAFSSSSVDRIGAGDSYLALSSLCMASKKDPLFASFLGSLAAAMSVQMIGNECAINKSQLIKFLIRMMK